MRTRKMRLLSFVLAVAMMFAVMPVSAFAAETTFEYEYMGQTLNYEVIDANKNFVKLAHNENIKGDVIIPKTVENNGKCYTVVEIGSEAINNGGNRWNNAPTTIKMPSTITKIDSSAFNNNWSLTQIEIPASVEDIGAWAFQWCGVVTKVTFEEGSKLKTIGESAFSSCKQVKEFVVPEGVTTIKADAFGGCDALESLVIPSTVTSIGVASGHGLVDDNGKVVIKYNGSDDSAFEGKIPSTLKNKIAHPHNVSFVMNGHGTAPADQTVYTGDPIAEIAEPTATAEGYNFAGWYTDKGLTQKFDVKNDTISGDTTLYAKWEKIPDHQLTVTGGTFTVKDKNVETKTEGDTLMADIPEGAEVTVTFNKDADSNLTFDGWKIEGLADAEKYTGETFTFTMPENGVTIKAQTKAKAAAPAEDDSWDAATVVTGVVLGTGTAILAYHIGTELYAEQVLGKDVAVPKTREDVALKAWELAGKPAVELNGEPLSVAAQAEKWAVESGLMQNDANGSFNGAKKMNKLKALRVLDAAKKLA